MWLKSVRLICSLGLSKHEWKEVSFCGCEWGLGSSDLGIEGVVPSQELRLGTVAHLLKTENKCILYKNFIKRAKFSMHVHMTYAPVYNRKKQRLCSICNFNKQNITLGVNVFG